MPEQLRQSAENSRERERVIDRLSNVPENVPLPPVELNRFNREYLEGIAMVLIDFVEKNPKLPIDIHTLMREFLLEYGLITERDHLDCLKLALRESLKHIADGENVIVLINSNQYDRKSQRLMSKALAQLLQKHGGQGSAQLIEYSDQGEYGIRDTLGKIIKGDNYQVVVIDDVTYSGVQFFGYVQRIMHQLDGLISNPEEHVSAFLAFDSESQYHQTAYPDDLHLVHTEPPQRPVSQLGYFLDYLHGDRQKNQTDRTIIPQAICTEYKYPDSHSVSPIYFSLGQEMRLDPRASMQGPLASIAELLRFQGFFSEGAIPVNAKAKSIKVFGEKQYPTVESLVTKVEEQIT